MCLINTLEALTVKELKRLQNSTKEYFVFDISVFNVGASIRVICTDKFKNFGRNWNGYDFIVENDNSTQDFINIIIKNKTLNKSI